MNWSLYWTIIHQEPHVFPFSFIKTKIIKYDQRHIYVLTKIAQGFCEIACTHDTWNRESPWIFLLRVIFFVITIICLCIWLVSQSLTLFFLSPILSYICHNQGFWSMNPPKKHSLSWLLLFPHTFGIWHCHFSSSIVEERGEIS